MYTSHSRKTYVVPADAAPVHTNPRRKIRRIILPTALMALCRSPACGCVASWERCVVVAHTEKASTFHVYSNRIVFSSLYRFCVSTRAVKKTIDMIATHMPSDT